MSKFLEFQAIVNIHLSQMAAMGLYITSTDKDETWQTYLDNFKPEDNPIYKERTDHDCQCCKQFIRNIGTVVAINELNQLVSVWDITVPEEYQPSVDAMAKLVKSHKIADAYYHFEANVGKAYNHQQLEDESIKKWDHFYFELPTIYVNAEPGTILGELRATKEVFKRGLDELTLDSAETVLDLIANRTLLLGDQNKPKVKTFITDLKKYNKIHEDRKDAYCWKVSGKLGMAARFRGTLIGTLLVDLSKDADDILVSIDKYNLKADPNNFKRCTSAVTPKQTKAAEKDAIELGILPSLDRRCAVTEDISVANVIYADKAVRKAMNAFDLIKDTTPDQIPNLDRSEEISREAFLKDIVPNSTNIQVLLENKHTGNLMTLVAPVNPEAPNILNWGNNFSWAYNGDITDSVMQQEVKRLGGNLEAIARLTILWNEQLNDTNIDLDAHCQEPKPSGSHIDFNSAGETHLSSGLLDIDNQNPGNKIAIENITHTDINKMPPGVYYYSIHNYSNRRCEDGFSAEIEINDIIYKYSHHGVVPAKATTQIAEVTLNKNGNLSIKHVMESSESTKTIWGITSKKFHRVNMIMNSPNHWDGEQSGNKHVFFILDKCLNPDPVRGFFTEFLMADLHKHRKTFEVLGSKMKAEPSANQLSGLGFSSSKSNQIVVKVEQASDTRTYKVNL